MKLYLTTIDNPFSPITEKEEWQRFDIDHGYYSRAYLGRIAKTSNELSDADNEQAINSAVEEIVRLNISGKHKKITVA